MQTDRAGRGESGQKDGFTTQAALSIEDSAQRMKGLLDSILAEARGERRSWRPVNLHALVLSTLGNLLPVARQRGVVLVYGDGPLATSQFPDRAVVVRGSVDQLASMVQNLASNAVKYAATEVRVELEEKDGAVRLEVVDDGRGIAPEDEKRIFQRGYQAADSLPGEGLGLFSARRVAEQHGGEIEVRSRPGESTRFRVVLPQEPVARRFQA